MEKDFHFYLIYALAKTAGLNQAYTIACASQFVDDNTYISQIGKIKTQCSHIGALDYETQSFIYVPFHFIPGDNRENKNAVTPNSENSRKILKDAIISGDSYRIGIALHAYADTWSHQNFTGYEEDWNSVFTWERPYRIIVPNVCHLDVGNLPDEISTIWIDHRLPKEKRIIDNRLRAIEACECIYSILKGNLKKYEKQAFNDIIYISNYDDRLNAIKLFVNEPDLHYSKHCKSKDFQNAAKSHLAFVLSNILQSNLEG